MSLVQCLLTDSYLPIRKPSRQKFSMSKRKVPESGRSPVTNRITRSRSSPNLNESSLDIESLSESSLDSAQVVDAIENRQRSFGHQPNEHGPRDHGGFYGPPYSYSKWFRLN